MTATGESHVPVRVRLRPMSTAQYQQWQARSIRSYADDLSKATGRPLEAELDRARRQFAELLPSGVDTEGTWIRQIVDEVGDEVGTVWVGPHSERPGVAFVYDIEVVQQRRGLGIGRAAMLAVENLVTAAGRTEIGLNVFGFNEPARHLYDSLGYRVVSTLMTKTIASRQPGQ